MYIRFSVVLPIAALAAVVSAMPGALEARGGSSGNPGSTNCNTGPIQCCQTTEESNPTTLSELGGLLGVVLPVINGLIGLNCDAITVVGVGSGSSCTGQTVCCTDNQFEGLVNLGCTPVSVGL